jgi:O-antigen ligase
MPGVLWQSIQPGSNKKIQKIVIPIIYIAMTISVVFMSGSRGSAISLLIVLLAFWLWKPTRHLGMISSMILVLLVISLPIFFETTLGRFAIERGDTILGGREALWQASSNLIQDNPWFGVGIGNAPYSILPYLRTVRSVIDYEYASVHNPVLTTLAETGIPGVLFYLGVLISALASFIQKFFRSKFSGNGKYSPYFVLISAVFLGYSFTWIKGGGLESDYSYFLMIALLLIPSGFEFNNL